MSCAQRFPERERREREREKTKVGTEQFTVAIQAPAHPPPVHPHDRLLLRPVTALGKHKVAEATVSFLRRTEYISSLASKRQEGGGNPRALLSKNKKLVRRAPEAAADSPLAIKRKIDIGFDAAERDLKDAKRLKHPTKKHLKLVDAAPLLPDLDAFPDSGAYVTIKFLTNPVQSGKVYDTRLLSGIFRPIDRTSAEEEAFAAAMEAHEADKGNNPKPPNLMNYDFYLGRSTTTADRFRSMFDVDNPGHDDEKLYTDQTDTSGCFQFSRLRAYETAQETEYDHMTKYSDEVLLAFNDEDEYPRQKAVYYYPVMQKSTIRPQRTKNIARTVGAAEEEEQIIDQLDVTVDDPSEDMRGDMERYKTDPLGWDEVGGEEEAEVVQEEEEEEEEAAEPVIDETKQSARHDEEDHDNDNDHDNDHEHNNDNHNEEEDEEDDADLDAEAGRNGRSPAARRSRSVSEEQDAEGEEDED